MLVRRTSLISRSPVLSCVARGYRYIRVRTDIQK